MAARPEVTIERTEQSIDTVLRTVRAWDPDTVTRALMAAGFDRLPMPGQGRTLQRWQCLEAVARHDLSVAKLYESHTDALAIIAEIDPAATVKNDALYAVWASEAPQSPLRITFDDASGPRRKDAARHVALTGGKAWCSGGRVVDRGLVTATDADGGRWLVEVDLRQQDAITVVDDRWKAVGMGPSATVDLLFDGARGRLVGGPNGYLERKGFWHGGIGVAACWYGAAAALGTAVRDLQRHKRDVHARAHLARIDCSLAAAAALLRECADAIDRAPASDARHMALRARALVAATCEDVLREAMHAVGPGPFCTDARLARHAADLPIFIRQMRAEHDLVAQADVLLDQPFDDEEPGWTL